MTDKFENEKKFKEKQEICLLSSVSLNALITEGKVLMMMQKLHRCHVYQVNNVHINICKT